MAQNVTVAGASYSAVPGLELPKTGGGIAYFPDVSPTTATAADVASGKVFFLSDGTQATGSASGGGGGAISIVDTPDAAGGTIRTITAIDISNTTATAPDVASGKVFYLADGTQETGGATSRSSSDLSVSGATVTAPAGIYSSSASASVNTMTLPTDASPSPSGTSYATINAALAQRYLNIPVGYNDTARVYNLGAMPTGTAGTPTATKSAVSNHSVDVTPSVTNTTGYISGSTKTGTAVTVSASELVSGSQTISSNGTVDVTNLAQVVVSVSGGGGKAVQAYMGYATVSTTSYSATSVTITVAKTGTYNVGWMGWRSYSSGTFGSQLYKNGTEVGSANTTFTNTYGHSVSLTNQSFNQGDVLVVRARASATNRYMVVGNLIIEEV